MAVEDSERESDLLTTNDVAKLAGVTGEAVRAWERAGKLAATRTASGMRLYRRGDVVAFIRKRAAGGLA